MSGFDRINGVPSDPDEYVGSGGAKGEISSVLHVNTTQTGTAADTNETTLWSYSLPANTLSANGRVLRIRVWGSTAANTNNKTIQLKFGATTLRSSGTVASNGEVWRFDALVVRTGAATQIALTEFVRATTFLNPASAGPTDDTAGAIAIVLTGTNGTESANDIVFRAAIVEALN